jgi:hypothetical protein
LNAQESGPDPGTNVSSSHHLSLPEILHLTLLFATGKPSSSSAAAPEAKTFVVPSSTVMMQVRRALLCGAITLEWEETNLSNIRNICINIHKSR